MFDVFWFDLKGERGFMVFYNFIEDVGLIKYNFFQLLREAKFYEGNLILKYATFFTGHPVDISGGVQICYIIYCVSLWNYRIRTARHLCSVKNRASSTNHLVQQ